MIKIYNYNRSVLQDFANNCKIYNILVLSREKFEISPALPHRLPNDVEKQIKHQIKVKYELNSHFKNNLYLLDGPISDVELDIINPKKHDWWLHSIDVVVDTGNNTEYFSHSPVSSGYPYTVKNGNRLILLLYTC